MGMGKKLRTYVHGGIYEIGFRTEDGLPLVCTPYMKVILEGIIVQGFAMYDITLLAFVIMGNHMHMMIRVNDPAKVSAGIGYVKRESGHAINNLLGNRRKTVWQEGFDAVQIIDFESVLNRLEYIYTNPAKADLETSIEHYPGLSSWTALTEGRTVLRGRRIPREMIPELPNRQLSSEEENRLTEQLLEHACPEERIEIEPLGFMDAFPEAQHLDREAVRTQIIARVRSAEERMNRARTKPVLGALALKCASIRASFKPKKFGKRMWCYAATKEKRVRYLNWMKERLDFRRHLKQTLSFEEFVRNLPPGFFAPGGYLRANLNPQFVPI